MRVFVLFLITLKTHVRTYIKIRESSFRIKAEKHFILLNFKTALETKL